MKVRAIAPLALALALVAGTASAASIGLFFDTVGGTCSASVPPFAPFNMYILALQGGPSAGGITGVEFRVDGMPGGWFATPTKNAAFGTELGNPLTGGVNLASATCQSGPGGVLLLYSISGFATSAVSNQYLSVQRHTNPSNPNYLCPLMVLCDIPVYTKVCVNGGVAIINGGQCTVGVEPASWSAVKALYE
jgi:hypothetical protein